VYENTPIPISEIKGNAQTKQYNEIETPYTKSTFIYNIYNIT